MVISKPTAEGTVRGGAPRPSRQRVAWLDGGRGLAIVLVVLVHVRDWLATAGWDLPLWEQTNVVLVGLRMPLFFAISGILAAKWLTRPWPELFEGKITFLLWVYLIWQPIGLFTAWLAYTFTHGHQDFLHWVIALAATVVRPRSEMWFLWALALYFVLARASRRVPVAAQLGTAAVVSAIFLSDLAPVTNLGWNGAPRFYLFFLLGCHLRGALLEAAGVIQARPWIGVVAVLSWLVVSVVVLVGHLDDVIGVGLAMRLLGLAAGISLAVPVARLRPVRALGARTLQVYVAHGPMIVVAAWLLYVTGSPFTGPTAAVILPPVMTLAIVGLSLLLYRVLRTTPAAWLYAPPTQAWPTVVRLRRRPAIAGLPARRPRAADLSGADLSG